MELICKESNEYAVQKGIQNFDFDILTLKLFLFILMLSGYVPLPRCSMYWEAEGDVHNSMVSRAMSRNKFSSIMSNIHFVNNNNLGQADRFAKVRPLLDHINACMLSQFSPRAGLQC